MRLFTIKCPSCGELRARRWLARPEYWPVAPQLIGGVLLALIFVLSRKRRFRCGQCGREFYCHTVGSRLWLALWIWFCISLAIAVAAIFLPLMWR